MRIPGRGARPRLPASAVRGERVLAAVEVDGGAVVGTQQALHVTAGPGDGPGDGPVDGPGDGPVRVPWERVDAADWDAEEGVLTVRELGPEPDFAPRHRVRLTPPGEPATPARDRLLQFVRERITATVVLQRHVRLAGAAGVHVLARRAPGGDAIAWGLRFDAGIDPDAPEVRRAAAAALEAARADLGLPPGPR
ncbi:hypothetical protein [Nocardioides sp. ChNu-99]|uniref:hypothetical protein n=1 Tax=Nocardioides sp. ChNu-99 TaxID=2839897 RepID=UPI0024076C81|nr:hypothetical protein [Nocardioides sp. ChNu-99]MDF9717650.1 hypothetical protein [Nocardioides sp. ChNu-99]